MKFTILVLGLFMSSTLLFAKSKEVRDGDDRQRHHENRAIAFSSVLMASSGGDPQEWKAIQVDEECIVSDPWEEEEGILSDKSVQCNRVVYFITQYDFIECADGTAHILRGGDGVILESPTSGNIFGFMEGVRCDDPVKSKDAPLTYKNLLLN